MMTRSTIVRRACEAAGLFALASQGACLSLDAVPQLEPDAGLDPDAGMDGPNTKDAAVDREDAEVPDASNPPPTPQCKDRGDYGVDETTVRGVREACSDGLVCVNGECVEPPACAPGVTSECVYTPAGAHGAVGGFDMLGEYLYWLELGSFDGFRNYQNDGAIARTRIGEWTREELVSGIDAYDEGRRAMLDGALRVDAGKGDNPPIAYVQFWWPSKAYHARLDPAGAELELDTFNTFCSSSDNDWVQSGKNEFKRRSRAEPTDVEAYTFSPGGFLSASPPSCPELGGSVFFRRSSGIVAFDLTTRVWRTRTPTVTALIGEYDGQLVGVIGSWVAVATPDASDTLNWRNVTGGTKLRNTRLFGGYAYWSRVSGIRKNRFIARGKLDGTGEAEVVAEISEESLAFLDGPVAFAVSHKGLVWSSDPYKPTGFHFFPLDK